VNEKNRNLVARVVSALVLLPLVLWLIGRGGYFTSGLITVVAAACAFEYFSIVYGRLSWTHGVAIAVAGLCPLLAAWRPAGCLGPLLGLFALLFLFAWISSLFQGELAKGPERVAHLVSGTVYATLGLTALSVLRQRDDGLMWVIAALVITWANDTLAYFVGRLLGRHKLYPAVSPNKTWEGFVGGFVGSVGGLFIARAGFFPALTALDCAVLGLGGGIFGPLGDLCESMLKRAYQTKDSGNLIPGHGGFLDRVDALLFNAPWVLVYVLLRAA
jgi:phosphatidate cytidylyltransferase